MEETDHGALVTKARESVGPERLPPPVRLLPRTPDLLGAIRALADH